MVRRRSSDEMSAARIKSADLAGKRKPAVGGETFDREHLLYLPQPRVVPLPEPVDFDWLGWRLAEVWEWEFVRSARYRERRVEMALFRGLID